MVHSCKQGHKRNGNTGWRLLDNSSTHGIPAGSTGKIGAQTEDDADDCDHVAAITQ